MCFDAKAVADGEYWERLAKADARNNKIKVDHERWIDQDEVRGAALGPTALGGEGKPTSRDQSNLSTVCKLQLRLARLLFLP